MNVFLIGTGTMGTGIAQVLITSPEVEKVLIRSRSPEKVNSLIAYCRQKLERLVEKEKLTSSALEDSISKLQIAANWEDITGCKWVIEAIEEKYESKKNVLQEVAKHVSDNTIVATNTSSLSITELAMETPYPENFIGLHFFNPAPLMELVEIIAGAKTSSETKDKSLKLICNLSKKPVVVEESPGFIVNRMLIPMLNEAITILAEGAATKEDIDTAMMLGAHHPMGPLKLSDFIGNDVVLSIMDVIYKETGDSKYRAHPLLRKMVRAGLLGRKTNIGFYEYQNA